MDIKHNNTENIIKNNNFINNNNRSGVNKKTSIMISIMKVLLIINNNIKRYDIDSKQNIKFVKHLITVNYISDNDSQKNISQR